MATKISDEGTHSPNLCPICGVAMRRSSRSHKSVRHFESAHPAAYFRSGSPHRPHGCQYCGAAFSTFDNYKTHLKRQHLDEITSPEAPPPIKQAPNPVLLGSDLANRFIAEYDNKVEQVTACLNMKRRLEVEVARLTEENKRLKQHNIELLSKTQGVGGDVGSRIASVIGAARPVI